MKSPLEGGFQWLILDEVGSTQDVAASILEDEHSPYGIVLAKDQKTGRGRMAREWVSSAGESLTASLIFRGYPNHPSPHLIGMSVAIAAAGAIHSQLQWPNDLILKRKKVGGLITELKVDRSGKLIPIVGLGINLNQSTFPESISHRAISLHQGSGMFFEAKTIAEKIVDRIANLAEPSSWQDIAPAWRLFDDTPGKRYSLPSGQESIAIGVGSNGELICTVNGDPHSVLAADALFGQAL